MARYIVTYETWDGAVSCLSEGRGIAVGPARFATVGAAHAAAEAAEREEAGKEYADRSSFAIVDCERGRPVSA